MASHIEITGADGGLSNWPRVAQQARQHPEVVAAAPFVQAQGMLSAGEAVRGVMVRGILPEYEDTVADFRQHIKRGSLDDLQPGRFGIVLGGDLARTLGVTVGDKVTLIAPQGVVTPAGVVPRLKSCEVVGIFDIGMYEYDAGLALLRLEDAQAIFRLLRCASP